jgi:hypothetical protein
MVLGVLATTSGVALAQVPTDRLSPAIMAGLRFGEPPATVRDLAPKFSVSTSDLRLGDATVQGATQNRAQGIGFGVEAGFARPTLESDDVSESGNAVMFGVWVGGNKGGRVGFTGEFLYVIRKITDDESDEELKTTALEIPAVFHINFGRGGPEDPMGYAIVGPVFTINLKQELDGVDISEEFNGADIGLMIGGGVEIFRIGFEVRYNRGLRTITADEGELVPLKSHSLEFVVKFRLTGA